MERKKRKGLASELSSLELRRWWGGGAEEKTRGGEGGVASPDLPESNGDQKSGQVRN
jgi:hypothetical protein